MARNIILILILILILIFYIRSTQRSLTLQEQVKKWEKGQRRKRMSAMLSGFLCNISCRILGYHIFQWKSRRDYVSTCMCGKSGTHHSRVWVYEC